MYAILDKLPVAHLLLILAVLQALYIYLFISLGKHKRKRAALKRTMGRQHANSGDVSMCDRYSSERMYRKTLDKINRSRPQKIIVSTWLHSDIYFFTEN